MADRSATLVEPQAPKWAWLGNAGRPAFIAFEFLLFFAVWELMVGVLEVVSPAFYPPPSEVYRGFVNLIESGVLWENARISARDFAAGYGLSVVFGVGLGLLMGTFTPIGKLLGPLAWALYAAPIIAIRPMTVVWFGFGSAPIIFLTFISALFPMLLNTAAGVQTTDRTLLRAGRVFGASRLKLYLRVRLPWTLPYILTGMRLAVPAALIGLLIGELLGSANGLGAIITISTSRFRTNEAFAVIGLLVVSSLLLVWGLQKLEQYLAPWRKGARRG